jgi:hypothetical protein
MASVLRLSASEQRAPLWALAAPALYLLACAAAIRAVLVDGADVGVSGLLLALGLVPAFAIPAVFGTRRARLALADEGLLVDGQLVKIDEARVERAERGSALLRLVLRNGDRRTFAIDSYADAQRLVAFLPPASAPAGALAI